jgi:ribosomal protein S27E
MLDPRQREPKGSTQEPKSPSAFSRLKCPNCGREPAIVFPLVRDHHESVEDAPLVCLDCCLTVRDRL